MFCNYDTTIKSKNQLKYGLNLKMLINVTHYVTGNQIGTAAWLRHRLDIGAVVNETNRQDCEKE